MFGIIRGKSDGVGGLFVFAFIRVASVVLKLFWVWNVSSEFLFWLEMGGVGFI